MYTTEGYVWPWEYLVILGSFGAVEDWFLIWHLQADAVGLFQLFLKVSFSCVPYTTVIFLRISLEMFKAMQKQQQQQQKKTTTTTNKPKNKQAKKKKNLDLIYTMCIGEWNGRNLHGVLAFVYTYNTNIKGIYSLGYAKMIAGSFARGSFDALAKFVKNNRLIVSKSYLSHNCLLLIAFSEDPHWYSNYILLLSGL